MGDVQKPLVDLEVRDAQDFLLDSRNGLTPLILDDGHVERMRGVAKYAVKNAGGEQLRKCLADLVNALRTVHAMPGSELPFAAELAAAEDILDKSPSDHIQLI